MRRDAHSRVLQFASYSFDMSVDDILMTLMVGGCVCVVSDEDRVSDISIPVRRMNINCAHLTPSYVDTQNAESLAGLQVLCVLGEAMTTSNIKSFAERLTLINTYGPSEAAVVTTVTPRVVPNSDPADIGFAIGSRVWIVDPNDHNQLSPIGAPGELLIEGPILARGYLHDEIKTNAAFITDPLWTKLFTDDTDNIKPRRFYKTGDVVQYCQDGSVKFLGRKDSQVKVRYVLIHSLLPYCAEKNKTNKIFFFKQRPSCRAWRNRVPPEPIPTTRLRSDGRLGETDRWKRCCNPSCLCVLFCSRGNSVRSSPH